MPFRRGENVGPYRVVEALGKGGMASVYKAYHAALDRYVALKVLHPAFLEDPNFLARFQREARVVAKLDHPNIVPIYDFAEHDGQPYLVMKYVPGHTLKALLQRTELRDRDGLRIVEAVGKGLEYAHQRGILHRDIKPSNVLLDGSGGIYLADFGLARIAQAGESTLSSEMLLGTPQYISPEQARGERELDAGTDIYSFGVVIYEMAVGQVPFNADTPFSIIHDHIYTPLPIPSDVNPEVSEAVERVLLKALAKERGDRFESVAQLVDAYHSAVVERRMTVPLEALPVREKAAPEAGGADGHAASASRGRRWWLWPAAGLLMACMFAGAFLLLAEGDSAQGEMQATVTSVVAASEPPPDPTQAQQPTAATTPRIDPASLARDSARAYEREEIEQGRRLALRAAELYLSDDLYVPAAAVLVDAVQYEGGPAVADPALVDRTTHAMYFAAESGFRVVPVLEQLWDSSPEWPPLTALSARTALHAEGPEAEGMVQSMIDRLQRLPADPLNLAVLAEYHLLSGEIDQGRNYAQRVLEADDAAEWLRRHVRELLRDFEAG